jgi:hypothetical protein
VERLTPEQIRLLEELRELRDSGILTVDEFEFQVAKVLGRPLSVEPSPVDEEPVVPDETVAEEIPDEVIREEQDIVNGVPAASDETHESELLEYEFVEPNVSDEEEILAEENQDVEPSTISDSPALPIADMGSEQNKSGRRKILIGTTVSLALVAVIGLAALVGGGKSDPASTQIVDNTTTVTQSTAAVTTQAPTTSTTTTTEVIPTTTYEVLQCPYTRVIEAVDGKIVTPEGITFEVLPTTYKSVRKGDGYSVSVDKYVPYKFGDIEITNSTNFRLRIGMEVQSSWSNGSTSAQWGPDNGRGWLNGFETRVIRVPYDVRSDIPINDFHLKMTNATIKYLCP